MWLDFVFQEIPWSHCDSLVLDITMPDLQRRLIANISLCWILRLFTICIIMSFFVYGVGRWETGGWKTIHRQQWDPFGMYVTETVTVPQVVINSSLASNEVSLILLTGSNSSAVDLHGLTKRNWQNAVCVEMAIYSHVMECT